MTQAPLSTAEFEAALRAKGAYYHIYHPYQVAMYEGRATREQIQGWVANRYYYQVNIPLKDAAILDSRESRHKLLEQLTRFPPARLAIADMVGRTHLTVELI